MPANQVPDDQQLLALLKKGDETAYTEIYKKYWAILSRHARRMIPDEAEVSDILQEVFLALWNKHPDLGENISLSGYLYTTVRNKVLNRVDHDKVKARYMASLETYIEKASYEADATIREKQLKALIEQEIAALPPQMRAVFELSRNSELSYKEIAEQLGISENTVRNHISRAIKILRGKFGVLVTIYLFLNS